MVLEIIPIRAKASIPETVFSPASCLTCTGTTGTAALVEQNVGGEVGRVHSNDKSCW
jgi:hypothetical protein